MNPEDVAPDRAQISAAMAQAALERDRKERAAACATEIQAALERHQCRLDGIFTFAGGRGDVQVRIVAT